MDIVGYAATVVGTSLMMPQLYKAWTTKRVDDLSLFMVLLYVVNCLLWTVYGVLLVALPLIITNVIAGIVSVLLLFMKLRYGGASSRKTKRKKKRRA